MIEFMSSATQIAKAWLSSSPPEFSVGDTVKVKHKVQEGVKTRSQFFEGIVIAHKHGSEPGATFTVRKMIGNIGVEKIFPLYSPVLESVNIIRHARVHRAKLYYIRRKSARDIRRKLKTT